MKQVVIKSGQAVVEDIPVPVADAGTVLVRVDHSCISVGTEMAGVRATETPLWLQALKRPDKVLKVARMAATKGVGYTRDVVKGTMEAGSVVGYSAAGTVVATGDGVSIFKAGDRVACTGAQCAHHAEYICVPVNLTVPVPGNVSLAHASTVALGAIALQGVRRAEPTLGETFVVVGLGMLGQLTAQFLKANGCRVIGADIDAARLALAMDQGMDAVLRKEDGDDQLSHLTGGVGADGVIVTAASESDEILAQAFAMCRRKGRVILVGDVGLNINRADIYAKELDFLVSTSYGPGRYDRRFEEEGLDYPVSYVRWTENRNMSAYLSLLATGEVNLEKLIGGVFSVDDAARAYQSLSESAQNPLSALLHYPGEHSDETGIDRIVLNPRAKAVTNDRIHVGIIGAGDFVKGSHLPNFATLQDVYCVSAVMSRTGHNAMTTANSAGARYATTDVDEILADDKIDLVMIGTRHNLHAGLALKALKMGKHVFVEKPLAMNEEDLAAIEDFFAGNKGKDTPVLMTGFNRRFSPIALLMREVLRKRINPAILNYRINAGAIPMDNWVHGPEGGGRNIGEACHIYDLFLYLLGSSVETVNVTGIRPSTDAVAGNDNFIVTLGFDDGSVASLTYTALGSRDYPKERLDVYVDGKVLAMDDFRDLDITGGSLQGLHHQASEKGQREELIALANSLKKGGDWPISLDQQLAATRISFQVESGLRGIGGRA